MLSVGEIFGIDAVFEIAGLCSVACGQRSVRPKKPVTSSRGLSQAGTTGCEDKAQRPLIAQTLVTTKKRI